MLTPICTVLRLKPYRLSTATEEKGKGQFAPERRGEACVSVWCVCVSRDTPAAGGCDGAVELKGHAREVRLRPLGAKGHNR
eukprot:856719-Rhodomonas_salina.1